MNESARSIPRKRSRTDGGQQDRRLRRPRRRAARSLARRRHRPRPARSSTIPAFVDPALATTAKSPSTSVRSRASSSRSPVRRPRASEGTWISSTSMTAAAEATEEWAVSAAATLHRERTATPDLHGLAGGDEGRQVPRRASGDEASPGRCRHPHQIGEPSKRLDSRPRRRRHPRASSRRTSTTRSEPDRTTRWHDWALRARTPGMQDGRSRSWRARGRRPRCATPRDRRSPSA